MKASDVRRLNKPFEEFGRTPDGRLRVRWFRTTELFYFVEDGEATIRTPAGLWIAQKAWKRFPWSELLGDAWVLAVWHEPMPRDLFEAQFGTAVPYPAGGEYRPVENVTVEHGDPTERHTALARIRLWQQLDLLGVQDFDRLYEQRPHRVAALVEECKARVQHEQDSMKSEWKAFLDNAMTAYGKIPGSRSGGVSFGGV